MKVCPTCSSQWPDETKFCPNDGSTLRSAAGTADLVGNVVADRYHIVKKLGEGGMGAVYLGEHVKMGRKSAIKVMTQAMAHDADAIARFNREAANAARITHPNVCAIYDFGETHDGLIYLAMEFIEGGSLTSLIEEEGALAPRRAARILQQTGEALQAAHDLGIVHRDLKPDNIMITKGREGADVVKVVDFGIAKAMSGEEGQKVTKTGLVVGTPEYMSPEQLSGDKLDGRSDIYSLALVFCRTLTGALPFQADSAQETMIKRLTDEPMKLSELMPGATFPPRLQEIMDRALARMPSQRYASASEFARDVVRVIESMGDAAATADDGATQLISAHGDKTEAIAATRIRPSTSGGKTAVKTPPTPMPQRTVSRPVEKSKPVGLIAAVVGVLVVGGGAAAVMVLKGGAKSDSGKQAVTENTAQLPARPDTGGANAGLAGKSKTGTQTPAGNQTGRHQDTVTKRGDQLAANSVVTNPDRPRGIQVNTADADTWLANRLEDISAKNAEGIKDTAIAFFDASGISTKDKAFAAYGAAAAFAELHDNANGLVWIKKAVQLDPKVRAYQALFTQLSGANE